MRPPCQSVTPLWVEPRGGHGVGRLRPAAAAAHPPSLPPSPSCLVALHPSERRGGHGGRHLCRARTAPPRFATRRLSFFTPGGGASPRATPLCLLRSPPRASSTMPKQSKACTSPLPPPLQFLTLYHHTSSALLPHIAQVESAGLDTCIRLLLALLSLCVCLCVLQPSPPLLSRTGGNCLTFLSA